MSNIVAAVYEAWDAGEFEEKNTVPVSKLNTMLNDALARETKESWNERLGEDSASEDLEKEANE